MDTTVLREQLKRHEGTGPMRAGRHLPYLDCCGKPWRQCRCLDKGRLTIGYGRNIEDVGISADEATLLLEHDIDAVVVDLTTGFTWFASLNAARKAAIANMRFQLGPAGFRGFKATIAALARGDFATATRQILASKYGTVDAPARAAELAHMVETGQV